MLYAFIEGPDDERFFNWLFKNKGLEYKPILYARKKQKDINKYISSINAMPDSEYILIADADSKGVEEKKNIVNERYYRSSKDNIYIVQNEIESWFLAGLNIVQSQKLKVKNLANTDKITKEDFIGLFKGESKVEVMQRILEIYDVETAIEKTQPSSFFLKVVFSNDYADIIPVLPRLAI